MSSEASGSVMDAERLVDDADVGEERLEPEVVDVVGDSADQERGDSDDSTYTLADVLALESMPLTPPGFELLSDGTVTHGGSAAGAATASPAVDTTHEHCCAGAGSRVLCAGAAAESASSTSSSTLKSSSVYYLDPVSGSMSNPGTSTSRPWPALANVMAARPPLQGGDVLVLMRGYHGAPVITGKYASDVIVRAMPGHTPVVRCLTFDAASHWDIGSLVITAQATPAGHPDQDIKRRGIDISTQTEENCSYITVRDTSLYTQQDASTRTEAQWKTSSTGIRVFATNYSIINCHIYNGGGLQLGFHSNMGRVMNCVIENFASDGSGLKASNVLFSGNCIYGSHKVSGNHNDLFQCWAARNIVFKNNFLAAYVNPKQGFLNKPGISDCQGMGCFDGWKQNWLIQGNVVKVDHPIGIWHLGVKPDFVVVNNTVIRCGKSLAIRNRPPCIHIAATKSGAASSGAIVANNLCENYELTSGIALNKNNLTVTSIPATFVNADANDLRLRAGSPAIGKGTAALPSHALPTTDMLGNPFINSAGRVDCGAFAAASTASTEPWIMKPQQPPARGNVSVVFVRGLGVDISWSPRAGDKSFVIMFDGRKIGTVRTGLGAFLWLMPDLAEAPAATRFTVHAVSTASY
jgi:hypothetical protein